MENGRVQDAAGLDEFHRFNKLSGGLGLEQGAGNLHRLCHMCENSPAVCGQLGP